MGFFSRGTSREDFVEGGLERIMNSSRFQSEVLNGVPQQDYDRIRDGLRSRLENAYQEHVVPYNENRGFLSKYVAPIFRGLATGLHTIGAYAYTIAGPLATPFNLLGAAATSVSDVIEGYNYLTHGSYGTIGRRTLDAGTRLLEGAATRVGSALIPGIGIIDAGYRARRKWDSPVLSYARRSALEDFMASYNIGGSIETERPMLSTSELENPEYGRSEGILERGRDYVSNLGRRFREGARNIIPTRYFQDRRYQHALAR